MFTIDQIKQAHSKVKSGADFPTYVQELKKLGVISYDNYLADGHTDYSGADNFRVTGTAKYPAMEISDSRSKEKLTHTLEIHQQGGTDYPTFCRQAAEAGVEKWTVHITNLTCTYYDKEVEAMLVEAIPLP
jgi:uncharacterized protein YbcV (DUF1398 family)